MGFDSDQEDDQQLHPLLSTPNGYSVPDEYASGVSEGKDQAQGFYSAAFYIDPLQAALAYGTGVGIPLSSISPGGSYKFGDGTLTSPSISWINDPTDGFYRVGSHDEAYVINSTKITEWTTSGFTINAMTPGSVLFAGTGGLISQNNASFFWDNATARLRIGTATFTAMSTNNFIQLPGTGATALALGLHNVLNTHVADRGPTFAIDSGTMYLSLLRKDQFAGQDTVVQIRAECLNSSSASYTPCEIWMIQNDPTAGAEKGIIQFRVQNSGTLTCAMAIQPNLFVGVGKTDPQRALDVLDTTNPQLRLTNTQNTVYSELQTNASGNLILTSSGGTGSYFSASTVGTYDLGASGTPWRNVYCSAQVIMTNGSAGTPNLRWGTNDGFYTLGASSIGVSLGGTGLYMFGGSNFQLKNGQALGWVSALTGTPECALTRSASNTLQILTANTAAFNIDGNQTLIPQVSLATGMTKGFINIPGAAGAASGTPATTTGFPLYYDSTNNKLQVYNAAWKLIPTYTQATGGQNLTNNVTSGGTDGTIANYTDLVIYANDAAAIRNDIYQLARALKQDHDQLRAMGILS